LASITSSTFRNFQTATDLGTSSKNRIVGCIFENNFTDSRNSGACDTDIVGCSFVANPDNTALDVLATDAGTMVRITGSSFEGNSITMPNGKTPQRPIPSVGVHRQMCQQATF
jgi:hypothetical protein